MFDWHSSKMTQCTYPCRLSLSLSLLLSQSLSVFLLRAYKYKHEVLFTDGHV